MSKHKAYYAVIPAFVRYHPDVSNGAKLLYGEITALTNEKGYCWASNAYFAELYQVTGRTISQWVTDLTTAGFISIQVDKEKGNERQIRLSDLWKKTSIGYRRKLPDPIEENFYHNNTVNNTENIHTPAHDDHRLGYPVSDLLDSFPETSFTPSHISLITSAVLDTPADRAAWSATLALYRGNYDPAKNSYRPEKVGTLLNVFRKERDALTRNTNGTGQKREHANTKALREWAELAESNRQAA